MGTANPRSIVSSPITLQSGGGGGIVSRSHPQSIENSRSTKAETDPNNFDPFLARMPVQVTDNNPDLLAAPPVHLLGHEFSDTLGITTTNTSQYVMGEDDPMIIGIEATLANGELEYPQVATSDGYTKCNWPWDPEVVANQSDDDEFTQAETPLGGSSSDDESHAQTGMSNIMANQMLDDGDLSLNTIHQDNEMRTLVSTAPCGDETNLMPAVDSASDRGQGVCMGDSTVIPGKWSTSNKPTGSATQPHLARRSRKSGNMTRHSTCSNSGPRQRSVGSRHRKTYDIACRLNQTTSTKRSPRGLKTEKQSNDTTKSLAQVINEFPGHRTLACPFYKQNCQAYGLCLRYKLRRPKDVRQHVYQKHMRPLTYCPRCHIIFKEESVRDKHIREGGCPILCTEPFFDGITTLQKQKLTQYVSCNKSIENQWYDIWDIIFDTMPRPPSVYLGNYLEQPLELLRSHWESNAPNIINTAAAKSGCDITEKESALIHTTLSVFFDQFENKAEVAARKPQNCEETVHPSKPRQLVSCGGIYQDPSPNVATFESMGMGKLAQSTIRAGTIEDHRGQDCEITAPSNMNDASFNYFDGPEYFLDIQNFLLAETGGAFAWPLFPGENMEAEDWAGPQKLEEMLNEDCTHPLET